MRVSGVPHFKVGIGVLEVVAALGIVEPVFNEEVDKDNIGVGANAIDFSTLIPRLIGSQVLGGSMRDHFLCGRIVLMTSITVSIPDGSSVVAGLIVVALRMEGKSADHLPYLVVVHLEVLSPVDIAEVLRESIAAASNDQVE
jgi:hypothetical protein